VKVPLNTYLRLFTGLFHGIYYLVFLYLFFNPVWLFIAEVGEVKIWVTMVVKFIVCNAPHSFGFTIISIIGFDVTLSLAENYEFAAISRYKGFRFSEL
jgi:hypothetical protein